MVKKCRKSSNNDNLAFSYGTRYMAKPIPKYSLPDEQIPGPVAYQLIHDELNMDTRPAKNLASFVTTWMEPEANQLISQSAKFNLADQDEYPHVIQMEERCVNMLVRLFNAEKPENAIGVSTIGSSEAVMLGGLAMKFRWRNRQKQAGKPYDKPNLVMGENVQVVWEKFTRYFDVEPRLIPVEKDRFVINAEEVLKVIDENTIGVCAILGSTFTGEFEPIEEINDALEKVKTEKGWDIPIHVDAASGGFVAPFLYPDMKWDFRLSRVVSINVSGHKFGLVYPGIGWVLWRDKNVLPDELIFHVNYLGGDLPTFTLNFSRSASGVVAQYYNFLRLGREGYTSIMKNLKSTSDFITRELNKFEEFDLIENKRTLPLVAWKVKENVGFDAFQLSDKLKEFGWFIPAYTMPKNAQDIAVLRIVVREHVSRDLAEGLIDDIKRSILALKQVHKPVETPKEKKKAVKIC